MKKEESSFREGVIVLFACSGGSKAGELTDVAARKLQDAGEILMSCPPAVSGQIEGHLEKLKKDQKVVVLDGCENDCVGRTLENAGFRDYLHIRLNELGFTKSNAVVNADAVKKVVEHVKKTMKKKSIWEKHSFSYHPSKDLLKPR
jgi:uncharacterized metal-binding protein